MKELGSWYVTFSWGTFVLRAEGQLGGPHNPKEQVMKGQVLAGKESPLSVVVEDPKELFPDRW